MPDNHSATDDGSSGNERTNEKLACLQAAFAILFSELEALPVEDRQLVLDTTFLSISGVVLHARTCAAALKCSIQLKAAGTDSSRQHVATDRFFRKFRETWLMSVLATPASAVPD